MKNSFTFVWTPAASRAEATVDIKIFDGRAEHEGKTIVLATEPENNPGISVTNGCEQIATQLYQAGHFPKEAFVFIEEYRPGLADHTLDLVSFAWREWEGRFSNPAWQPITRDDLERWTGGE
jgi:hypothetical protein